jgi:serine/threonine-protein kinase
VPVNPGDHFGGYRIDAVLGRGGMGTVYLATQERLDRRVALKLIAPELAEDAEFRARFLRESQLAASLDDPNVIPIYDTDEVDGVLYLAMRYVRGASLLALLRERGSLPQGETLTVSRQIARALDAAHAAGLVHRDVKPANILVADPGGHAYLCDFGLAKRTSSQAVTRAGFFLGTVDYSAPEQIEGGAVDGRADVYALACVVYHCLAGRPPFVRDSELAVLHAHLHDALPSLGDSALDAVLAKATAKRREARFGTAGEFAAALAGIDAPRTKAAPVVTPTAAVRRPRWPLAVLAALAAAGGIAGGVIATSGGGSERPAKRALSLPAFVDRVETALERSSSTRRAVGAAISDGLACRLTPHEAGKRISEALADRRRTLSALRAINPPARGARSLTLLEQALQRSIEADAHYRDGFAALPAGADCPLPGNAGFRLASAADKRATVAKERFVEAFDPLATALGGRTWSAGEF